MVVGRSSPCAAMVGELSSHQASGRRASQLQLTAPRPVLPCSVDSAQPVHPASAPQAASRTADHHRPELTRARRHLPEFTRRLVDPQDGNEAPITPTGISSIRGQEWEGLDPHGVLHGQKGSPVG